MATLGISTKLDFVNAQEINAHRYGHRFHGTDGIFGLGRGNLFFAGNQRHVRRTHLFHQPRIDFTGKQPQRQANDTAPIGNHALDGIMRLAGIGGSKNGRHTAAAQDHGAKIQGTVREVV